MKKWTLFMGIYFALCLILGGCGVSAGNAAGSGGGAPAERSGSAEPAQRDGGDTAAASVATCRVVEVGDGNQLLLADTETGTVYTLAGGETLLLDGRNQEMDWAPKAGVLAEIVHDGTVLETWPAQFANVASVNILSDGFDDRCALYLQVLEDLWNVDPGLNSDPLANIGVDLSDTSLPEGERSAVAWTFAQRHGGELVTGTWEELADQGYIDRENLCWEDGCLFSITEKEEPVVFNLPNMTGDAVPPNIGGAVAFDAQKWRSGTGAYFLCDCTAVQDADGHWGSYTVGSEAIS